ncbi:Uncharacterised protein [Raoultella planticola]|uniref:hypothetical protein n=1 Tax=Raoultella planticola TaxID=575 RepID=UPI0010E3C28A|nr:hypothetical protein [Raoultella planticola]VTM94415.1 Uncharacterised protein [Raoultella planticola]
MKEIFLKFIICMVVIGVAGGFLFYMAKNDYRERQPATPEQLTAMHKTFPAPQTHSTSPSSGCLWVSD